VTLSPKYYVNPLKPNVTLTIAFGGGGKIPVSYQFLSTVGPTPIPPTPTPIPPTPTPTPPTPTPLPPGINNQRRVGLFSYERDTSFINLKKT
jgi:hypothetical protein